MMVFALFLCFQNGCVWGEDGVSFLIVCYFTVHSSHGCYGPQALGRWKKVAEKRLMILRDDRVDGRSPRYWQKKTGQNLLFLEVSGISDLLPDTVFNPNFKRRQKVMRYTLLIFYGTGDGEREGDPRRGSSDGRSPSNRWDKCLGRYGRGIPEGDQATDEALATDGKSVQGVMDGGSPKGSSDGRSPSNRWEKCLPFTVHSSHGGDGPSGPSHIYE